MREPSEPCFPHFAGHASFLARRIRVFERTAGRFELDSMMLLEPQARATGSIGVVLRRSQRGRRFGARKLLQRKSSVDPVVSLPYKGIHNFN
jgi:hypothetical protein